MRHLNTLTKPQPSPAQIEALRQLIDLIRTVLGFLTNLRRSKERVTVACGRLDRSHRSVLAAGELTDRPTGIPSATRGSLR